MGRQARSLYLHEWEGQVFFHFPQYVSPALTTLLVFPVLKLKEHVFIVYSCPIHDVCWRSSCSLTSKAFLALLTTYAEPRDWGGRELDLLLTEHNQYAASHIRIRRNFFGYLLKEEMLSRKVTCPSWCKVFFHQGIKSSPFGPCGLTSGIIPWIGWCSLLKESWMLYKMTHY